MTKSMPWIKQYPNRLHDVRLAQLNDRQQLRYYQLYLLAGHLNADGAFMQDSKQLSPKEIAFFLRVKDADQLSKDMQVLKKCGLLKANGHGPFIAEFQNEQINWMEKQRDERERQKRKREADKSNGSVTRDTSVSTSGVTLLEKEEEEDSDKDSDSDKEEDKKQTRLLNSALEKFAQSNITLTDKDRASLSSLLGNLKAEWIPKAIKIALENKKRSAAYVIGILKNWRSEHANNSNRNKQTRTAAAPVPKPTRAATSAAAKRIIASKRKDNASVQ